VPPFKTEDAQVGTAVAVAPHFGATSLLRCTAVEGGPVTTFAADNMLRLWNPRRHCFRDLAGRLPSTWESYQYGQGIAG
jgi:hypothetical protein